jgi:hypothetical protein
VIVATKERRVVMTKVQKITNKNILDGETLSRRTKTNIVQRHWREPTFEMGMFCCNA